MEGSLIYFIIFTNIESLCYTPVTKSYMSIMMIIYVNKKYLCIYVCMYVWIYKEISLIISNVFPSNYSFFLFVVWSLKHAQLFVTA